MNEFQPYRIPDFNPESETDALLIEGRIRETIKRMNARLENCDPELVPIVQAMINLKQLNSLSRELNERLNELSAQSEALIESPNANDPEVKAERKELADRINVILSAQLEFDKNYVDIASAEALIRSLPPQQLAKAEEITASILSETEFIANPVTGLN